MEWLEEYLGNIIRVLQVGDHDQHASEEREGHPVVVEPIVVGSRDGKSDVGADGTGDGGDHALHSFRVTNEQSRIRPEVRTITESKQGVDREPLNPSRERNRVERLFPPWPAEVIFVLNPNVSVVLVDVVSELKQWDVHPVIREFTGIANIYNLRHGEACDFSAMGSRARRVERKRRGR